MDSIRSRQWYNEGAFDFSFCDSEGPKGLRRQAATLLSFLCAKTCRKQSKIRIQNERKRYSEVVQRSQGVWLHPKREWGRRVRALFRDPVPRLPEPGGRSEGRV